MSLNGQELERVVQAYKDIRLAYSAYLLRTGALPSVQLESYDRSIVNAYNGLLDQITAADSTVDLNNVRSLAQYILRGYVLYNL